MCIISIIGALVAAPDTCWKNLVAHLLWVKLPIKLVTSSRVCSHNMSSKYILKLTPLPFPCHYLSSRLDSPFC